MTTASRMILILTLGSAAVLFTGCTTGNRTHSDRASRPTHAVQNPCAGKDSTTANPCEGKAANPCNPCGGKADQGGDAFDPWGNDRQPYKDHVADSAGSWW